MAAGPLRDRLASPAVARAAAVRAYAQSSPTGTPATTRAWTNDPSAPTTTPSASRTACSSSRASRTRADYAGGSIWRPWVVRRPAARRSIVAAERRPVPRRGPPPRARR